MTTTATDPLAALKTAETAELERVRQTFRAHREAAGVYAEGTKLRDQAAELEERGRQLQATAVTTLLDSGMTAADIAPVIGLDVRRVRELAKLAATPTAAAATSAPAPPSGPPAPSRPAATPTP